MTISEVSQEDRPLSEQYRVVAKQWVDADAAAKLLEETKTATFSELVLREQAMDPGIKFNRAEAIAKSSSNWREFIETMVAAKREANLKKVHMEFIRMRFSEWQTLNANSRQERVMSR